VAALLFRLARIARLLGLLPGAHGVSDGLAVLFVGLAPALLFRQTPALLFLLPPALLFLLPPALLFLLPPALLFLPPALFFLLPPARLFLPPALLFLPSGKMSRNEKKGRS